MAYQLIENDPLAKTEQCEHDADLMKQLGVNAIRVYHVNEAADHRGCMNAFARAGIYCFIDLDSFYTYIRYVGGSHTDTQLENIAKKSRRIKSRPGPRTNPIRIEQ